MDTLILWNAFPVGKFRDFFIQTTGKEILPGMDFQTWLFSQAGKTLSEALEEYLHPAGQKTLEEFFTERRFNNVSESDKEFIIAFDKEISALGYDFGSEIHIGHSWGSQMLIIYGKTNTKSRPCPARIWIRENDVLFQIYFNNIDAHQNYIENTPAHIKEVFTNYNDNRSCKACRSKCGPKEYTIDGNFLSICRDAPFWFNNPSVEKLPDYIDLIKEFYIAKPTVKS